MIAAIRPRIRPGGVSMRDESTAPSPGPFRLSLRVAVGLLILLALVFGPVGRLDWAWGWVYLGTYLGAVSLAFAYMAIADPELLKERTRRPAGAKGWDRVLVVLFGLVSTPASLVVAGLDVRFGWSPPLPLALQLAALSVGVLACGLGFWAMVSNTFFSTFFRIQTERGHAVVSAGPYRIVRHPGYVGVIAFLLATPLILGSLGALVPAGVGAAILIVRTALEDQTLHRELEGYPDYARRVRHRLLPGVW